MQRLAITKCMIVSACLSLITGCGGCGSGVSSSNIAQYSRTRLPEELDSATVIAPPPPVKSAAVPPPVAAASASQAATARVISADDPTPNPQPAPAPSVPAPTNPPPVEPSAPRVIDADDPTPIPPPLPVQASPQPNRPAVVAQPGQRLVIDADDPTPILPVSAAPVPVAAASGSSLLPDAADPGTPLRDVQRAIAVLHLPGRTSQGMQLASPPTEAEQKEVKGKLRELYASEIKAATTPEGWQALYRQLMQDAERMQVGSSTQFVMFTIASEIALKQGDLATVLKATDQLQARFDVVLVEPRLEVLRARSKTVGRDVAAKMQFLTDGQRLIDAAIERNDFAAAAQVQKALAEIARRWGDARLNRRLQEMEAEIDALAQAFEPVPRAAETLQTNPTDTAASQIVGWYLCCVRNLWDEGLPLLARSNDVRWKVLTSFELSGKSGKQMVQLADEWWSMSDKAGPAEQRNLRLRARHWYSQAVVAGVADLEALRAERQLKAIERLLGPYESQDGSGSSPVPQGPQARVIVAD